MVRPIERIAERRQIRRAAEEALTDPRLRLPLQPLAPRRQDPPREDLPPGFGGAAPHGNGYRNGGNGYAPHPATTPAFTNLTFRLRPTPWYRSNAAKLTALALGLAAALASVVWLLWPASTSAPQDAGTTAPAPSPSASLTPTQTAPPSVPAPPVNRPPAELPPPPPPPLPAAAPAPAAPRIYYPPRYDEPPQQKPQTDVTRAPISVAPSVKPNPSNDSSTPGDAPKQRRGSRFPGPF